MLDNKNVLFGVVLLTVLIAVGIFQVSGDIAERNTLDADSQEYLSTYNTIYNDSGIDTFKETGKSLDKSTNPLASIINLPFVSDFLGAVSFSVKATLKMWNYMVFTFNIPTFILSSFGMNVGAFSIYLDVLSYGIFIGLLYFLLRSVK